MKKVWTRLLAAVLLTMSALVVGAATSAASPTEVPRYKHIFYIVEENRSFNQIVGNPDAP